MRQQALENLHRLAPHLWKAGREAIARLELLSYGSASAWNPGGSRSVPGSRAPSGDAFPLHALALERYADARTARDMEDAVRWAENRLGEAQKGDPDSRPEGESEAQRAERAIDEGEGLSLREAALRFSFSESRIRKMRMAANLDPTDGTEFPANRDTKARALELHAKGWSTREIQKVTGVHKTQVLRWVEKERAA